MIKLLYISIFIGSVVYSQDYCAGDVISEDHQNQSFDVCYPCDECDGWSLSDYEDHIIFIDMSASWCAPCYSSIDLVDNLEHYWEGINSNVKFITALADIGEPYSCQQWGLQGSNSNTIVEDDGTIFNWFQDSNAQYPNYVIIDHEMRVVAKPSGLISNGNDQACDGGEYMDSFGDFDCINSMITDLLSDCGEDCDYAGTECLDDIACNTGDNADCIYPANNYDCCGECATEVDCLGECGGDATAEDCLAASGGCPSCIIVPTDEYPTIQSGIDAAMVGDTVLVEQGTYFENLVIDKTITLISRAVFDDLSTWMEYDGNGYVVANYNIQNTIIDGDGSDESILYIETPDGDNCSVPTIQGFTIQNGGQGSEIDTGESGMKSFGGGFLAYNSLPTFNYNLFSNNGDDTDRGGGGAVYYEENFTGCDNQRANDFKMIGNAYGNNEASYGNSFASLGFDGDFDMSESFWDVYNCPENDVTGVWVDVEEGSEVDFSYGVGDLCSITEDVWVSPIGSDDFNLGTSEAEAFLTIERAIEMIAPQDDDPITINLKEGTFAPSTTFESFPIIMISNVNLIGQGEEVTTIDAEQTERVILMHNCTNNIVSDLTISGGYIMDEDCDINSGLCERGGGMYVFSSTPILKYLTVKNNSSDEGGGLYIHSSSPSMHNVSIIENSAERAGGVWIERSDFIMDNMLISNNAAGWMNIRFAKTSTVSILNSVISNNTAGDVPGVYIDDDCDIKMVNVEISNNISDTGCSALKVYNSSLDLKNVSIVGNTGFESLCYDSSTISMENSISWNNIPNGDNGCEIMMWSDDVDLDISYSNVQGLSSVSNSICCVDIYVDDCSNYESYIGTNNINNDPLFINPENNNYSLGSGSPCIDTGNPNPWYKDIDGTYNDMGSSGGPFIHPKFIEYDFGEIGNLSSSIDWTLYNMRDYSIVIDEVSFQHPDVFSADIFGTVEIQPHSYVTIPITCEIQNLGQLQDEMVISSPNDINGLAVPLSVVGVAGDVLNGNLVGELASAIYRVTGPLIIAEDDAVIINKGSKFLFDGEFGFEVYGVLKAQGTVEDSIIFENYGASKWQGFTMKNQTEETILEYVRITGAHKDVGGGINLDNSNPVMNHVTVSYCSCNIVGGGICVVGGTDFIMKNLSVHNNTASYFGFGGGGGIWVEYADHITIQDSKVFNNNSGMEEGGGINIDFTNNPVLNNVELSGNIAHSGGGIKWGLNTNPIMINSTITDNIATGGGGMRINLSTAPIILNTIMWNNSPQSLTFSSDGTSNAIPQIDYSNIDNGCIDWTSSSGGEWWGPTEMDAPCRIYSVYGGPNENGEDWCDLYGDIEGVDGSPNEACCICGGGVSTSNIFELTPGVSTENNMVINPQFMNPNIADYRLSVNSDCIDAGTADIEWTGVENIENFVGLAPDMGAFEYYQDECGVTYGDNSTCLDECGEINGDNSSCSDECGIPHGDNSTCTDQCGIINGDGWSCIDLGDVNQDFDINIFDIIMIVDYIFYPSQYPFTANQILYGDVNADGSIDIQDIIIILGYIHGSLGRELNIVEDLDIYQSTEGLYIDTDGFIGLDITISHDPNFSFTLTEEAFLASSKTENNITRMIIADPTSDMLFETEDKFEIEDIKVVSKDGLDVNVNIILMPTEFTLSPAYPNPFNPTTTLSFALPKESNVSIVMYDLKGSVVTILINSTMQSGYHKAIWDASQHASGMYFVQIIAGDYMNTQKLMLVK